MSDRSIPDPLPVALARLAEALLKRTDWIEGAGDADLAPLATRLASVLEAFRQARALTAPLAGLASQPVARAEWLHALRAHTTAIVGWIAILRQTGDRSARRRGMAAIERNAAALQTLLSRPPASSGAAAPPLGSPHHGASPRDPGPER